MNLNQFKLLIVFLFLPINVSAEIMMEEITEEHVVLFRNSMFQGCVAKGTEQGNSLENVKQICKCSDKVMEDNLTKGEYKLVIYKASKGMSVEEILGSEIVAKFQECKNL